MQIILTVVIHKTIDMKYVDYFKNIFFLEWWLCRISVLAFTYNADGSFL